MCKAELLILGLISLSIMFLGSMSGQIDNVLVPPVDAAQQGRWEKMADMPTARGQFACAVANGKIYAIGGIINPKIDITSVDLKFDITSTVEEYDPIKDKWTKKNSLPIPKMPNYAVSTVNGIIYSIGGSDLNKSGNIVYAYNPAKDEWTRKADMPTPRENFATEVVKGKIYAIGGIGAGAVNANEFLSSVDEYDPKLDTWTKKSDMPESRNCFGAATFNNKIYILGGTNPDPANPSGWGTVAPEILEYDPVTDKWAKKSKMPTPRIGAGAVLVDNKIYTIGGFNDINALTPLAIVEIYDPANDIWSNGAEILMARSFPCCVAVDDGIYVIGGFRFEGRFFYTSTENIHLKFTESK
jgi:N-acetylneuraminic acid mutarotase